MTEANRLSDLPKNFNWKTYIKVNPDLVMFGINTERRAQNHYLTYGIKEGRQYDFENELPVDFDITMYKWLNEDLDKLTDSQLIDHFSQYSKEESRIYKLDGYLPPGFDPRLYKLYNTDLTSMNNHDAIKHYILHGSKEGRVYFAGIGFDKLMRIKNNQNTNSFNKGSVVLINHDVSLTGAPLFLYDLYDELTRNNIFKNIIMIEPFPNKILPDLENKIYHYNDSNYLYDILSTINPCLIYANSLGLYAHGIPKFKFWHNKTILHFHEISKHVNNFVKPKIQSQIRDMLAFVVSDKIKEQFLINTELKNVHLFPPFITQSKQQIIQQKSEEKITDVLDLDHSKPLIGMCGDLNDRKNILLFIKMAKQFNKYNFMWVGGKDLQTYLKKVKYNDGVPDNLYWIPNTKNPYKYFKAFNYFFLTSKEDPCPIVVLENLLLNNKIIVIKDNIKTDHKTKLLENYLTIEGKTDEELIDSFARLSISKDPNLSTSNSKYIENYYTKPEILKLNTDSNLDNWIICSLFLDKDILDIGDIDACINMVNTYILRQNQYKIRFAPVIVLSSNYNDIYGDRFSKYLKKSILNLEHGKIVFKENYGYDIAGLVEGVHTIYENWPSVITPESKITYIHNKSNESWSNLLHEILHFDDLKNYETIASKTFTVGCPPNDINRHIFDNHPEIFEKAPKDFAYVQGTIFSTNIELLKMLHDKYDLFQKHWTHDHKNDILWQNIMLDDNIFQSYMDQYSDQTLNQPIDKDSQAIVKKGLVQNYMELQNKYGLRGIPDGQFEHALERYIGHLMFTAKPKTRYKLI